EVGLEKVGDARGGFDAVLRRCGAVAAREVSELELLIVTERFGAPACGAARADGGGVAVEVEEVAALGVGVLLGALDVEKEAGEVLAQAHVAEDEEELLLEERVAVARLEVAPRRVA